ncbi:hypothetical protein, partial [Bernardetia sp.]|uniref:hypothetical protein n=1 Tax=Bernardetia sp. TaxID=1937974 RepID=UPI0025BD9F59
MRIYKNEFNSVIFAKDDGTVIETFPTGNFKVTRAEQNRISIVNPLFGYQTEFLFSDIKDVDGNSTGATIADTINYLAEFINFRIGGIGADDLTADNITEVQGEEGSVQYKNALGKIVGDAFFLWKNRLLSILGSVVIKSLSALAGNALEVRNSDDDLLMAVSNGGVATIPKIGGSLGFGNSSIELNAYYAEIGAINSVVLKYAQGSPYTSATFGATINFERDLIGKNAAIQKLTGVTLNGVTQDLIVSGTDALNVANDLSKVPRALLLRDGKPREDTGIGGEVSNGVRVESWETQTGVAPILRTLIEAKEGNKLAFYGATPVAKQNLSSMATTMEIVQTLENLGL